LREEQKCRTETQNASITNNIRGKKPKGKGLAWTVTVTWEEQGRRTFAEPPLIRRKKKPLLKHKNKKQFLSSPKWEAVRGGQPRAYGRVRATTLRKQCNGRGEIAATRNGQGPVFPPTTAKKNEKTNPRITINLDFGGGRKKSHAVGHAHVNSKRRRGCLVVILRGRINVGSRGKGESVVANKSLR